MNGSLRWRYTIFFVGRLAPQNRGDKARIGASADEVIDAIEKNGYFRWPRK